MRRTSQAVFIGAVSLLFAVGCASISPPGQSGQRVSGGRGANAVINGSTAQANVVSEHAPAQPPWAVLAGLSSGWPTFGNNLWNDHFSNNTALTPLQAHTLSLAYHAPLPGGTGSNESYPLEADGRLYVTTTTARVVCLSATSGRVLWQEQPSVHLLDGIPQINRGVAFGGGDVYVLTADDHLVALQQSDGRVVFNVPVANGATGVFESMAPLYVNGRVIIGSSGGDEGVRGFVAAYDGQTGHRLWQFSTVPARGQGWMPSTGSHGGGAVWTTPAYNPATDSVYFGTGNPSPDYYGAGRRGPDPYTDAVVDVTGTAGKLTWYRQEVPHDLWDYDVASPPILFPVNGQLVVGEAGKDGEWYEWNAATGQSVAPPVAFVRIGHSAPTPQGTKVYPSTEGGANYGPSAYSPVTKDVYVAGISGWDIVYSGKVSHSGYYVDLGTRQQDAPTKDWTGTITAIDSVTGHVAWQVKTPTPPIGGVTVTAGGVLLFGQPNGILEGLDAATGKPVWSVQTGTPLGSAPIVYTLAGRTFVTVVTGGAASLSGIYPWKGRDEVLTYVLPLP